MRDETLSTPAPSPGFSRTVGVFLAVLVGIALLRILVGFVAVPVSWVNPSSYIVSVVFVAAPILGLYAAANWRWNWGQSTMALVIGLAVWWFAYNLAGHSRSPLAAGTFIAISQSGLLIWCFAIGSLLAQFLKDKNLLVPMAIFLALFDMWLVFAPEGLVQRSVFHGSGKTLQMLGYQAPATQAVSAGGKATAMLFVGPADLLFLSMFFAALFRFNMRTRETLRAILPVLAVYLMITLLFPDVQLGPIRLGALPALVPIGLTVLIVNRKQFHLSKDELATTVVIAVVGAAIVTWRILIPQPPETPEPPSMSQPGQEEQAPPGSTWTIGPDRSPLRGRIALRSTQDPR